MDANALRNDFRTGLEWQRRYDYPSHGPSVLDPKSESCYLFLTNALFRLPSTFNDDKTLAVLRNTLRVDLPIRAARS